MKTFLTFTVLLIIILQSNLKAQYTQAFDFVNFPHSVSTFGNGWQGVASLSNDDALTYNPAKLSLTKNTRISFYRNPYQLIVGPLPIINLSLYHKEDDIGSFGVSYENWDFGEFTVSTPENPFGGETFHSYERSFSAGYARNLKDNLSAGIQFRYSYANTYKSSPGGFFISFGFLYNPECLQKRLTLGFSLMNLGSAVKYEMTLPLSGETFVYYDPPPSKLNLGIYFIALFHSAGKLKYFETV